MYILKRKAVTVFALFPQRQWPQTLWKVFKSRHFAEGKSLMFSEDLRSFIYSGHSGWVALKEASSWLSLRQSHSGSPHSLTYLFEPASNCWPSHYGMLDWQSLLVSRGNPWMFLRQSWGAVIAPPHLLLPGSLDLIFLFTQSFCLDFWQNDWSDLALNLISRYLPNFLSNCSFSLFPPYWNPYDLRK